MRFIGVQLTGLTCSSGTTNIPAGICLANDKFYKFHPINTAVNNNGLLTFLFMDHLDVFSGMPMKLLTWTECQACSCPLRNHLPINMH